MVNLMSKRNLSWLAAAALVLPLTAQSAELNIEFEEPERFSDIEPGQEIRTRFLERTLEGFERIFSELAETLPEDQVLKVKVTDIDLAGYIDYSHRGSGSQPLRIVRQGQTPKIDFEYALHDADGNLLQQGEEQLRGRGISGQSPRGNRAERESLRQERDMIERWFERTFE